MRRARTTPTASSSAFAQAGSSIAEVGQQLGDWLKRNRGQGGDGERR